MRNENLMLFGEKRKTAVVRKEIKLGYCLWMIEKTTIPWGKVKTIVISGELKNTRCQG